MTIAGGQTVSGAFAPSPGTVVATYTFAGRRGWVETFVSTLSGYAPGTLTVRVSRGGIVVAEDVGRLSFTVPVTGEYTLDMVFMGEA